MAAKISEEPECRHMRNSLSFGRCSTACHSSPFDVVRPSILSLSLSEIEAARKLVRIVKLADVPVVVEEANEEVMVAMTPRVFERILFERTVQLL